MADTAKRESPLIGFTAGVRGSTPDDPGVKMTERPFLGYVNLRGDSSDGAFTDGVAKALEVTLPIEPNTIVERDGLTVCWLGPDEWMAITPPDGETDTAASLHDALGDLHVAVTDYTGYYTMVNLEGPHARDLLAKGCTLDLHPRAFMPGRCAQTNVAKATGLLVPRLNRHGLQSFDVVVRRSFADYLALWIEHSAREYGLKVAGAAG